MPGLTRDFLSAAAARNALDVPRHVSREGVDGSTGGISELPELLPDPALILPIVVAIVEALAKLMPFWRDHG